MQLSHTWDRTVHRAGAGQAVVPSRSLSSVMQPALSALATPTMPNPTALRRSCGAEVQTLLGDAARSLT